MLPLLARHIAIALLLCGGASSPLTVTAFAQPAAQEDFEPTFSGAGWEFPNSTSSARRLVSMSSPHRGAGCLELSSGLAPVAQLDLESALHDGWMEIWVDLSSRGGAEIDLGPATAGNGSSGVRFAIGCGQTDTALRWQLDGNPMMQVTAPDSDRDRSWRRIVIERIGSRVRVFEDDLHVAEAEVAGEQWQRLTLRLPVECGTGAARFDGLRFGSGETQIQLRGSRPELAALLDLEGRFFTLEFGVGAGRIDAEPSAEAPYLAARLPVNAPHVHVRFSQRTHRAVSLGFSASMAQEGSIDRIVLITADGMVFDPSRHFYAGLGVGPVFVGGSDQLTAQDASDNGLGMRFMVGAERIVGPRLTLGVRLEGQYLDAGAVERVTGMVVGVQVGYWFRR